jgi:drug/metabolite transporter (DMT)-like permease
MRFPSAPAWALVAGAALWGVVWWPYRLMAQAGIDGLWSTLFTYGLALVVGIAMFPHHARVLARLTPWAVLMGLSIGWSNLAYVLAVLDGEVMRVLLLFYLAPLWTVPLARVLLKERLDRAGLGVMALAFAGAVTMLWHPEIGLPWPRGSAEWLGLLAGFLFALGNVLVRKLSGLSDAEKSIVIWAGVVFAALVHLPATKIPAGHAFTLAAVHFPLVGGVGVALIVMSLALQYGLSRLPATRAIVILLSELVVAAFAAYFLAGETLRLRDWVGGGLIVAATLLSAYWTRPGTTPARPAAPASSPSSGARPPPS